MSKIPTLTDRPRLREADPMTPTRSPNEMSAPFKQVGQIADQVASSMYQLQKKQKAAADKIDYSRSLTQFERVYDDMKRAKLTEFEGTNHENLTEEGMIIMRGAKDKIINDAPESIRSTLSADFDNRLTMYESKLKGLQAKQASAYAVNSLATGINDSAKRAASNWNALDIFREVRRNQNNILTSEGISDARKQKLLEDNESAWGSALQGVIDRAEPQEMIETLTDLEDKDTKRLMKGVDPRLIDKRKTQIKNKLKDRQSSNNRELTVKTSNAVAAIEQGTLDLRDKDAQIAVKNLKDSWAAIGDDKSRMMIDKIEIAEAVHSVTSEDALNLPKAAAEAESKAKSIASDHPDLILRAGGEAKALAAIQEKIKFQKKQLEADVPKYIEKYDPQVALLAKEVIAGESPDAWSKLENLIDHHSDKNNISRVNRKYITPSIQQHVGDNFVQFMDAGNSEAALEIITDFDAATNGKAYALFQEMNVSPDYAAAAELVGDRDTLNALRNINDDKLEGAFKQAIEAKGIDKTMVENTLRNHELLTALSNQDGGTQSGRLHAEAIYNTVYREYKRLVSYKNMNPKQAEKEAWGMVEKRYTTIENLGSKKKVLIPREFDSENAQNFLDTFTGNADYVEGLGVALRPKKTGASTTKEEMNYALSQTGEWVYSKRAKGLALFAREADGTLKPVPHKDGGFIIKTYEDLKSDKYKSTIKRERSRRFQELIKSARVQI